MSSLADLGEDELIRRLLKWVPLSEKHGEAPGDDCAVVDEGGRELQLLKTDALVEGMHYEATADPEAVGWKAIARVVSDFAAMGGKPDRFLITLALQKTCKVQWVEDLYRGMGRCLEQYGAILAGGETCSVPEGSAAVISVAATGRVERDALVLRSGGGVEDEIWVTGRLGGSIRGKHLSFSPRVAEAAWLVKYAKVTAMMDLSDGLAKDLPRLADSSGCGFQLEHSRIPVSEGCQPEQALNDGEDFELLFTVRPGSLSTEAWADAFPELELSRIGELVSRETGETLMGGWDHFT